MRTLMSFHTVCEIHRGHQENQRYSFSSQNFSRKRLCKQFHAELGGQGNPDRPVQPLSCCTDTGQPKNSDKLRTVFIGHFGIGIGSGQFQIRVTVNFKLGLAWGALNLVRILVKILSPSAQDSW